jgi:hypothetical protein
MLALYRDLITLRRNEPCLANCRKDLTRVWFSDADRWLVIERGDPSGQLAIVECNLSAAAQLVPRPEPQRSYRLALATEDSRYGGVGATGARLAPRAARIYLSGGGAR